MKKVLFTFLVCLLCFYVRAQVVTECMGLTYTQGIKWAKERGLYNTANFFIHTKDDGSSSFVWYNQDKAYTTTAFFDDVAHKCYKMRVVITHPRQGVEDGLSGVYTWFLTQQSKYQWTYKKLGRTVYVDYEFPPGGESAFIYHY